MRIKKALSWLFDHLDSVIIILGFLGGIAVIILSWLQHLPLYQVLLILLFVVIGGFGLIFWTLYQIRTFKITRKKGVGELDEKATEDTIRDWLDDPQHSIRRAANVDSVFNFVVTDANGEKSFSVTRPKANPNHLEIACNVSLSEKHKIKYATLSLDEKEKIVNNLRIEMARYGISYQNLNTDLNEVLLGDVVFIDNSLTEYYFKSRIHFVLSGLVLYSEVITQGLMSSKG